MKPFLKQTRAGIIITGIFLAVSIVIISLIISAHLLSTKYILVAVLATLLIAIAIFALTMNMKKRALTIVGAIVAFVFCAVQIVGYIYIGAGIHTLKQISGNKTEYTESAIYVRKDDPAKNLADIKGYTLGILATVDREVTDEALNILNEKATFSLQTVAFEGLTALLDALLKEGSVGAILLNKGFLDLIDELEYREGAINELRELYTIRTEKTTEIPEQENPDVFTLYISGIDCSGSLRRRSRSDVNIIATVNKKTGEIALVTTPRDFYVPLSISNGIPDKLTHAGVYGVDVSRETLEMLYGIKIDYYFKLNFDGFKEIINALDGITVNSKYDFKMGKYTYTKGANTLDGDAALAFARCRKSVTGGEYTRGLHQMEIIKGVIAKLTNPAVLINYNSLLDGIAHSFETNVPYEKIAELVSEQLDIGTKWNVTSYSTYGTGSTERVYSLRARAYVVLPDSAAVEHAKNLMAAVRNGKHPEG